VLYRYWRQGQTGGRLALVLIAGTVPGVIAGSVIRVELLPGPRVFDLVIGRPGPARYLAGAHPAVACRGAGPPGAADPGSRARGPGRRGGLRRRDLRHRRRIDPGAHPARDGPQGIGGRSRRPGVHVRDLGGWRDHVHDLALYEHGSVAPAWPTGIALGVGGLAGAYAGARFQSRMPDALIRRLMGILVIAIGAQYLWSGLS
jgi:hypothetical protein